MMEIIYDEMVSCGYSMAANVESIPQIPVHVFLKQKRPCNAKTARDLFISD